ncbi:hypothetical protein [Bartonella australis]|uniref:hypothetical protein n=1 Tax=Bartonella australis TaxID=388640 RepID=UPI000345F919|nr:hypothetical protein [Bartonella australis]
MTEKNTVKEGDEFFVKGFREDSSYGVQGYIGKDDNSGNGGVVATKDPSHKDNAYRAELCK